MEPYIEILGPALIVVLCCYAAIRRLFRWAARPEPEEKEWHPSRHYRGGGDYHYRGDYGGDYGRGK